MDAENTISMTQVIARDLERWDRPRKPVVRLDYPLFNGRVVDVQVYRCPLIKRLRVALAGSDGVYWSWPEWTEGGVMVLNNGRRYELRLANDAATIREDVLGFLSAYGAGVPTLGSDALMVSTDSLSWSANPDSEFQRDRVALVRHWALTQAIPTGIGGIAAFELSIRSARERHVKAHHTRKWRNAHRVRELAQ